MALVQPFRAVRYDEAKAGPLESLVAPPYDVLGPEERAEYLARSPYNVVRLTLPDSEEEAARDWRAWREEGVLVHEPESSYWALEQDYEGPDGVARTRTGLVASLRVEPYERRIVLPHERTHRGPKEGRLRLLRAVRAQLESIFLLYDAARPFVTPARPPELELADARLWRLPDDGIREEFAELQLLIADGHHRYETALAFHEAEGTPESAFMPVVLVSTRDPGLTIFPTHRVAEHLEGYEAEPNGHLSAALEALEAKPRDRPAVLVYRRGGRVSLLEGERGLDTAYAESLGPEGVTYTPRVEEAVEAVETGRAEAALLVRPPRIEDVFAVAQAGETMPQKSTYFYPKLLSGLLFHPV